MIIVKLEEIAKLRHKRDIEGLDKENRKWKWELEEALKEIDALRQSVNIAEEDQ